MGKKKLKDENKINVFKKLIDWFGIYKKRDEKKIVKVKFAFFFSFLFFFYFTQAPCEKLITFERFRGRIHFEFDMNISFQSQRTNFIFP